MSQQEEHLAALLIEDVDTYFKQLVETYQHQLYGLMYHQVNSTQDASEAIASLPEHYRVVLSLYYFQQLSYQEIADLLHQPLGTVKSKLHRGLNLVRAVFNTVCREEKIQ